MNFICKNKVIAITGATSGIGLALAKLFLLKGAKVSVCARSADKLNELSSSYNKLPLLTIVADVSKKADCQNYILKTIQHFGTIDILINNAGISMRALFEEVDIEVLKQLMDINFWGAVYCTKFAFQEIKKNKGSIVAISSIAAYKGLPCRTGYVASKFALNGLYEALRVEVLQTGIHVMTVAPGFVASNIRNTALNSKGKAQ